jgi:hypothetical protein
MVKTLGKPRKEMDGIKVLRKEELQSFIARTCVQFTGYKRWQQQEYNIHIPVEVARFLQLQSHDILLVAIKKASSEDIDEFERKGK